jgi:hypothetical protein
LRIAAQQCKPRRPHQHPAAQHERIGVGKASEQRQRVRAQRRERVADDGRIQRADILDQREAASGLATEYRVPASANRGRGRFRAAERTRAPEQIVDRARFERTAAAQIVFDGLESRGEAQRGVAARLGTVQRLGEALAAIVTAGRLRDPTFDIRRERVVVDTRYRAGGSACA